jgi:hypothetical protein
MRGWCATFLVFVFLFVLVLRQDGSYRPYAFFVPFIIFFLFVGYATVSTQMDVLVDDSGISRCIGRKIIRNIRWDDVQLIRVFDVYNRQEREMRIGVNIYPRSKVHSSSLLGGKVAFGDHPMRNGNFSDLVDLVNKYIVEHQIEVESTVGGVKTLLDRIYLQKRIRR